jgi:hypothetical protein
MVQIYLKRLASPKIILIIFWLCGAPLVMAQGTDTIWVKPWKLKKVSIAQPGKWAVINPIAETKNGTIQTQPIWPASGAMQQWGWFCMAEWRLQQKTKIPLYLRLGSKNYTDWLEGKRTKIP